MYSSCVVQVYSGSHGRTMVFTQTKQDADELAVSPCLSQDARVLHGDIVQKQREVTLKVCKCVYESLCAHCTFFILFLECFHTIC